MPHAAPTTPPPVPPAAPVPVLGQCAPLSEQSTPWEIFTALARVGMHFLIRFLPFMATLARSYPRHWRAFLESSSALVRVLLTVRFAPERITKAQLRRLWRARQLIESFFGCPLPIFHPSAPLGARTPSSAIATFNQSPSASTENATPLGPRTSPSADANSNQSPSASTENVTPLGARTPSSATATVDQLPSAPTNNAPTLGTPISRLASAPTSSNPHPRTPNTPSTPSTPAVPQVPFCSLSHFPSRSRSDADSPFASDSDAPSATLSRSPKRAPASLQAIIAQLEAQEAQSQSQPQSPHSAFRTPHSSILPPFIPDVNTLHAALKADTLPVNCAGALLDHPGDTLVKALQQVHALLHAFPQLSPSPSPSQSSGNPQSKGEDPVGLRDHNPQSDALSVHPVNPVNTVNKVNPVHSVHNVHLVHPASPIQSEISNLKSKIPSPSEKAQCAFETASPIPHSVIPHSVIPHSDIPHSTAPP